METWEKSAISSAGYKCGTCGKWVVPGELHNHYEYENYAHTAGSPHYEIALLQQIIDKLDRLLEILGKNEH